MFRYRAASPPEFTRQPVDLFRSGRSIAEPADEFEPSAEAIRSWIKQADRDEGRRDDGPTSAGREEPSRLRREVKQVRQERDILAKAAAWFARHDVTSSRSSGS
jgi:transposase